MHPLRAVAVLTCLATLTACFDTSDEDASPAGTSPSSSTAASAPDETATSTSGPAATDVTDDTDADTTTTAPPTTVAAAAAAPDTTAAPTTTSPPATTPPPTTPPATTPAGDCLVGQWVITEGELNAYYDSLEAGLPQVTFTVTGTTGLEFTGTEYIYTPAFTLALEVAGTSGTGDAGGTVRGTYTTADGVLMSELGEGAVEISVTVNGVTMDGSDFGNGLLNQVPFVESPYSCDGPTIMFETVDEGRHPVVLAPAG